MASFFKSFGKGILYLFVLPFLIVILAFYGIYGLGAFIVLFFKSVYLFFTGRSLHDDLPEDKKAKEILQPTKPDEIIVEEKKEPLPETFHVYQPELDPFRSEAANKDPYQARTVEEGLFGVKEEVQSKVEEAPVEEAIKEEPIHEIEPSIDDFIPQNEPLEEEVIDDSDFEEISTSGEERYKPVGSEEYDITDDALYEEEEDSGVDIFFDEE